MACITKSICYNNYYSVVSNISNFNLIIKLLVEDIIFDYQPSKKGNNSEFTNLYIRGSKSMEIKDSLKSYQYRACKN